MRIFAKVSMAAALAALVSGTASAASLVFSSSANGAVAGQVVVDMWLEDSTRTSDVAAIQFDVTLGQGAGATNSLAPGVQLPNVSRDDGSTTLAGYPFDLNQAIADPAGAIDVRVVHASSDLFDLNSLAADATAYPNCLGANACAKQASGNAANRIYLGSFNLNYDPRGVFLKLTSIFGEGDLQPQNGTDPIVAEIRFAATRMDGGSCNDTRGCRVEGLAPEPTGLALMGLALAAFGVIRRR